MEERLIVKSSVTKESQPATFTKVSTAVVLLVVYVTPLIQVNASHAVCTSVDVGEGIVTMIVSIHMPTPSVVVT